MNKFGYEISSYDESVYELFLEYFKETKSDFEEEIGSATLRDFRIRIVMISAQDTWKSLNEREDDLISITDIKGTSSKQMISSNTNYNDTSEGSDVWVITKLTLKEVFKIKSKWSFWT